MFIAGGARVTVLALALQIIALTVTVAETLLCVTPQTGVRVNVFVIPVEYVAGAAVPFGSFHPLGVAPKFQV